MSQDTVKNRWRKPWLCVCWKRTFLHRSLIVKSQQNKIELVTRPVVARTNLDNRVVGNTAKLYYVAVACFVLKISPFSAFKKVQPWWCVTFVFKDEFKSFQQWHRRCKSIVSYMSSHGSCSLVVFCRSVKLLVKPWQLQLGGVLQKCSAARQAMAAIALWCFHTLTNVHSIKV